MTLTYPEVTFTKEWKMGRSFTKAEELKFINQLREDYFSDLDSITDSVSTKQFLDEIRMRLDSRITVLTEGDSK